MKTSCEKVNIVHHVYNFFGYSGATDQAIKLTRSMDTEKFIFLFINSQSSVKNRAMPDCFNVIDLPKNPFYKILYFINIILRLPRMNTVHHVHGFHFIELVLLVLFRRKFIFKCTLLGADDLSSIQAKSFGTFKLWLIKHAFKINSLNPEIDLINSKFIAVSNRVVIPNGVDLPRIAFDNNIDKKRYVIFVGALIPRKGVLETLDYFALNFTSDVKLKLIGPFGENLNEFDSEYFNLIKDKILFYKEYDIEIVGKVDKTELARYYTQAEAMLFFSKREGTPNVVLEAMAHNCPILFSNDNEVVKWLIGKECLNLLNEAKCSNSGFYKKESLLRIRELNALRGRVERFDISFIARETERLYLKSLTDETFTGDS